MDWWLIPWMIIVPQLGIIPTYYRIIKTWWNKRQYIKRWNKGLESDY